MRWLATEFSKRSGDEVVILGNVGAALDFFASFLGNAKKKKLTKKAISNHQLPPPPPPKPPPENPPPPLPEEEPGGVAEVEIAELKELAKPELNAPKEFALKDEPLYQLIFAVWPCSRKRAKAAANFFDHC